MLKQVSFTNFKSWAATDMPFGSVTGIFGANSSGKTSIIQFLLLLKQTKEATDRAIVLELNGSYVELGSIRDALHKHDLTKEISWVLSFWPPDWPPQNKIVDDVSNPQPREIASGDTLKLIAKIGVDKEKLVPRSLAYQLGKMRFELSPQADRPLAFDLSASSVEGDGSPFEFKRTVGRPWSLPGPIKSYGFPDRARTSFQNAEFLAGLEAGYEEQMDRLFYLGPLRDFPRRDYLWTRSRPTDVGRRGEKAIDAILAATDAFETRKIKRKGRGMPFQKMVAYWLREMGLIESFSVNEIASGSNRWQAHVKTRSGASEVLLPDVGFGVSQVLPVVTLLQYVPEGSTVILEQPEIHLHPLAQAGLADIIVHAATTRRVQVVIESHSEHLLLRLQRRIAEEAIAATDVKLYFCDAPQGVSALTQLEVDLFGNIKNWPKNFMGDAFGETVEAERARLVRMKAAQ
jgi:predicted ATPase